MGLQEENYKEYADHLFKVTKKFGIKKGETHRLLSHLLVKSERFRDSNSNDSIAVDTIKDVFDERRISAKYVDVIRYILHADTLYIRYFEVYLPFYRDQDGKESLIDIKMEKLKQKVPFWYKWRILNLNYRNFDPKDTSSLLKYFKDEEEIISNDNLETVEAIHNSLCDKYEKLKKPSSSKQLFEKIDKRIHIYERIYRCIFYLAYYSWIRESNARKTVHKNELDLQEKIRATAFEKVRQYLEELNDRIKEETDYNLNKTIRLLWLYYAGNKSMSDYEGSFPDLSKEKIKIFLDASQDILNFVQPKPEDELVYRVWHKYYYYLYLQMLVQNEIINKNYFEALDKINIAQESLKDIQGTCRGGFNRIRIKCIYHKRYLDFILNSIEAYLQEKETFNQFGSDGKTITRENYFYDDSFDVTLKDMQTVRMEILKQN